MKLFTFLPESTNSRFTGQVRHVRDEFSGNLRATPPKPSAGRVQRVTPPPRQLPRRNRCFVGREREVRDAVDSTDTATVLSVSGMAGVGKTAFALHLGYDLAATYPDGQIFIDLRGHRAGSSPVSVLEALGSLLLAVGTESADLPVNQDDRAGLWRTRLWGRKLLLILDDATGHDQVRPLLPGSSGCMVIITSRRRLAALEDVFTMHLDVMSPREAAEMFLRIAEVDPADTPGELVDELVALCGHLPLAIALMAGRLRSHPSWSVAYLLEQLGANRTNLAELCAEDVGVTAAFSLSFQDLSDAQRLLLRTLRLHPGNDFDEHAAAALAGTDLNTARRGLESLFLDNLVEELTPGRYRIHDLIRNYLGTVQPALSTDVQDAAISRLLEYYTNVTRTFTYQPGGLAEIKNPAVRVPAFGANQDPADWLSKEWAAICAAIQLAATHGSPQIAAELSHALHPFLRRQGHWLEALEIHRCALGAVERSGDLRSAATILSDLGVMAQLTGSYQVALTDLNRARESFAKLGDTGGEAATLSLIGVTQRAGGDCSASRVSLERAHALFARTDDHRGVSTALSELALLDLLRGDHRTASLRLHEALSLAAATRDDWSKANATKNLGMVQMQTGRFASATSSFEEALRLYATMDNRRGQANVLRNLGAVCGATGDSQRAKALLTSSLKLYLEIGDQRGAAHSRTRLAAALLATGDPASATADLELVRPFYNSIKDPWGTAAVLCVTGAIQHADNRPQQAAHSLTAALELHIRLGDRYALCRTFNDLGAIASEWPEAGKPIEYHRSALAIAVEIDAEPERQRALSAIRELTADPFTEEPPRS